VDALKSIGGSKAATAIDDAATRGDRMVKRVIASRH
jgi:hypothetical protein